MAKPLDLDIEDLVGHFETLEDPRSEVNLLHPLSSVIVIAIMAILAGANGPTAIARWANTKAKLLLKHLKLPHGIPQKDVFRRVLGTLKPDAFQACFNLWITALRTRAQQLSEVDRPTLAVDGKTARRTHDRKQNLGALHSVSVWASEYGLSLGQVATDDKSNEITAIPKVLSLVDLRGAIVTIDAMGTQRAIARQIVDAEADFVLALKKNQRGTHKAVADYIQEQMLNDFRGIGARRIDTTETKHGRTEHRTYVQMPVPSNLPGLHLWAGLRSIGIAILWSIRDGKETNDMRYFISSLPVKVKQFAHAVRSHWSIENSCHWCLDMTYREDELRVRDVCLRENLAWLNRLTLSLLKQHPSKDSIVMKRRACGWDDDFMLEVLTGMRG
jgi:predicted transposase YbfD/YdcC